MNVDLINALEEGTLGPAPPASSSEVDLRLVDPLGHRPAQASVELGEVAVGAQHAQARVGEPTPRSLEMRALVPERTPGIGVEPTLRTGHAMPSASRREAASVTASRSWPAMFWSAGTPRAP